MPPPLPPSPANAALAAARLEIDQLDDQLLALFERRLELADRISAAKDSSAGPYMKLHAEREYAVLARMLGRARADNRDAVESLWRQIMGWGLARQQRVKVQVWSPIEPSRTFDDARLRFGAAADMRAVRDPEAALAWAAKGHGVAVLAVNADSAWWIGLRRDWSMLSVFDGFGGPTPTALAVGCIDPATLPGGPRVIVDAGGDAGDGGGMRRCGLATHHGWNLSLTDADLPVGGREGCVGAIRSHPAQTPAGEQA